MSVRQWCIINRMIGKLRREGLKRGSGKHGKENWCIIINISGIAKDILINKTDFEGLYNIL